MTDARTQLLERVVAEVAANGLRDRSLREIAEAVGSSHRMLHYHFGSRDGLVAAIVDAVEADQRQRLRQLAATAPDVRSLVLALWEQVSSVELRPFVRLFFDTVVTSSAGGAGASDRLTEPWLTEAREVGMLLGHALDPADLRLGVAVTRGLLIDVVMSGDAGPATEALHRFLDAWVVSPSR